MSIPKPKCCTKDESTLESVGRIWLHSNFLHVGLPPYELLEGIWSPHKKTGEKDTENMKYHNNDRHHNNINNVKDHKINDDDHLFNDDHKINDDDHKINDDDHKINDDDEFRGYQEFDDGLVTGYRWDDVDFRNKELRNKYRKLNILVVAVFDVLE